MGWYECPAVWLVSAREGSEGSRLVHNTQNKQNALEIKRTSARAQGMCAGEKGTRKGAPCHVSGPPFFPTQPATRARTWLSHAPPGTWLGEACDRWPPGMHAASHDGVLSSCSLRCSSSPPSDSAGLLSAPNCLRCSRSPLPSPPLAPCSASSLDTSVTPPVYKHAPSLGTSAFLQFSSSVGVGLILPRLQLKGQASSSEFMASAGSLGDIHSLSCSQLRGRP